MKTAVFSLHKFEKSFLENSNNNKHELLFIESRLTSGNSNFRKRMSVQ